MNTMEGHSKYFKQAFWYLPNIGKLCFTKLPLAAILFYRCGPKSIGFLSQVILKTMQSLKTIIESNLDLEHPQAKSPHGGHLVFKMATMATTQIFKSCWGLWT